MRRYLMHEANELARLFLSLKMELKILQLKRRNELDDQSKHELTNNATIKRVSKVSFITQLQVRTAELAAIQISLCSSL